MRPLGTPQGVAKTLTLTLTMPMEVERGCTPGAPLMHVQPLA